METISYHFYHLSRSIPGLFVAQGEPGSIGVSLFKSRNIDPSLVIWPLIIILILLVTIIYSVHRYNQWKSYKEFEDEMKALDLEGEHEGTFVSIVKKYEMEEPVNVLYRPELFDEMATKEIVKVLGSAGSTKAKEHFIDVVYEIRRKTYQSSYYPSSRAEIEDEPFKKSLIPAPNAPLLTAPDTPLLTHRDTPISTAEPRKRR